MRKTSFISLLIASLWIGTPAPAQPAGVDRLAGLLLAYDHAPDRKAIEGVVADPVRALVALHADTGRPYIVRLRAVDALGLFPSLQARGVLHRLARDPSARQAERVRAATALAYAFGAGAMASLEPLLRAPDPVFRLAVADALLRYAGAAGRAAVTRAAELEKLPDVVLSLRRMLRPGEVALPSLR